eukprot:gb/GECG01011549.1/.p1 GENE.gb/GECG01011549.1/~~gb/GECG01011549.1/.p1  ORF type:complete len:122 (+),score=10.94 gb/GECG01011549.1/:1-366(+)
MIGASIQQNLVAKWQLKSKDCSRVYDKRLLGIILAPIQVRVITLTEDIDFVDAEIFRSEDIVCVWPDTHRYSFWLAKILSPVFTAESKSESISKTVDAHWLEREQSTSFYDGQEIILLGSS